MALQDALIRLESTGLMDVLLPFALIFSILYAVSAVVPHFKDDKRLRIVLATIISLVVVIPHVTNSYPPGMDVVSIINASIPQVVMIIVGAVLAMILVSATTTNSDGYKSWLGAIRWIALILVGLIFLDNINFGYGTGFFGQLPFFNWFSDPDFQALFLIIVVFGLIITFVVGGDKDVAGSLRARADKAKSQADAAEAARER